jgi:predicted DNA-binding transcriptional regulator AlpA
METSLLSYAQESLDPYQRAFGKDRWLKAKEVCAITGMSKAALYRSSLAQLRIKIGRSSFWSELAVQRWMREQAVVQ